MNQLHFGFDDKTKSLIAHTDFREPTLLIDDGQHASHFLQHIPARRKVHVLDWERDAFNPLTNTTHFLDALPWLFPRTNTLTREDADFLWQNCLAVIEPSTTLLDVRQFLLSRSVKAKDKFFQANWEHIFDWDRKRYDAAVGRVVSQITTMLLHPQLRKTLTGLRTFSPDKFIIATIDRAYWGEFYSFLLATLLVGQFHGQVIIPDFGAYGRDFHINLIRQNRLVVGLNSLSELPTEKLQQAVLAIPSKAIYRTTRRDAEALVIYTKHTEPKAIYDQPTGQYITV